MKQESKKKKKNCFYHNYLKCFLTDLTKTDWRRKCITNMATGWTVSRKRARKS